MTNEIQLNKEFIRKVTALEQEMLNSDLPGIIKGNSDAFPLTHSFSDGVYIREMFMGKGGFIIGKLHKYSHTWFLLKGELEVATEYGVNHYVAPCYINAPCGTKRVIHALEDSVFVNVHANPDNITNIEILEDKLVCDSYEAYNEYKLLNK